MQKRTTINGEMTGQARQNEGYRRSKHRGGLEIRNPGRYRLTVPSHVQLPLPVASSEDGAPGSYEAGRARES